MPRAESREPLGESRQRTAVDREALDREALDRETLDRGSRVEVEIVDRQRVVRIGASWLTRVVRAALARQKIERAEVCVLLVDDRRIAALHRKWLGLAGPTDVITFDLSAGDADGLHGDIAVSTETARRVAREVGWAARLEVAYYAVHGLLHLAGYDDHAPAERRAMRARERVLLAAAGLPPPPRGRSGWVAP